MEEQVLGLLRGTLASQASIRESSELQIKQLQLNEGYPGALVSIGGHANVAVEDRQAALFALNRYVPRHWSSSQEDYEGQVELSDEIRNSVRDRLLMIVFGPDVDTKIMNATAAVIASIAKTDFPEDWPGLMDTLLQHVQQASDEQADAICTVLKEVLRDALDEEQFYHFASPLVESLRHIATDGSKRLTTRASAVSVFGECFAFVQNLKDKDADAMQNFARNVTSVWTPFLLEVVKEPMPQFPSNEEETQDQHPVTKAWRGIIALKRAVVVLLMKIQDVFAEIMPAQELFSAVWHAVQSHAAPYHQSYISGERQGNMMSVTGAAYTIDLLVIEELDYMESLLEAPEVKRQLDSMLASDTASNGISLKQWVTSVLEILITFSCIPREAEEMWSIDYNIFLTEETFAESSSTPRSMCASFAWKLSNHYPEQLADCLQQSLAAIMNNSSADWRQKEAVFYNLQQVAEEYENESRKLDPGLVGSLINYVQSSLSDANDLLRARAHTVMAAIIAAWFKHDGADHNVPVRMTELCVQAIGNDESDVVKVACIRIIPDYLSVLSSPESTQLQGSIVAAIGKFLESQDLEDPDAVSELVDTVLQTLRDTIMANPMTCLEIKALDVILTLVKYGAARDSHSSVLIDEAFTSAAEAMAEHGADAYSPFCQKVLPSLVAGLDIQDPKQDENVLVDVSVSLIRILAESARSSLPDGFVNAVMPRLCRLIYGDVDFYLMQSATLTIKVLVDNDSAQVFGWVDPNSQKSGLEVCFMIIGHLVNQDDASAAEVGELANAVVEKAGTTALGGSMQELVSVFARRLATANHLQLIQSIVMVFARLATISAADLVTFLDGLPIEGESALAVVVRKWLENSTTFAGFEAIGQNMQALVALYSLHSPHVYAINVQGDLIPDNSSRIRTRSQAKSRPIQYTSISAPLKIVKLVVGELVPYNDPTAALKSPVLGASAPMVRKTSLDDEWDTEDEDEPFSQHVADDSTQRYLVEFMQSQADDARFQELYQSLTDEEKERGRKAVEQYQAIQAQTRQLQTVQLGAVPR